MVSLTLFLVLVSAPGCTQLVDLLETFDPPKPLDQIPGPEDDRILGGERGTLLWSDANHEGVVEAISLPDLTRHTVRVKQAPRELSGPDERGRFVYLSRGAQVRLVDLSTGRDIVVMARERESERTEFAMRIALAPRRGQLLVSWEDVEGSENKSDLSIWDLDHESHRSLGPLLVERASWLPDARHVAIELWVTNAEDSRASVPDLDRTYGIQESLRRRLSARPSIQILDTETGQLEWIAWGRRPFVSFDGKNMLYCLRLSGPILKRDLDTGIETPFDPPGLLRPHDRRSENGTWFESEGLIHGWLSDRSVMYEALATRGQSPGFVHTKDWSSEGAFPKWTVKVADIPSLHFATLLPSVNNPTCSFGAAIQLPPDIEKR